MGELAGFRYRDITRKLRALGFRFDRQARGSHEISAQATAADAPPTNLGYLGLRLCTGSSPLRRLCRHLPQQGGRVFHAQSTVGSSDTTAPTFMLGTARALPPLLGEVPGAERSDRGGGWGAAPCRDTSRDRRDPYSGLGFLIEGGAGGATAPEEEAEGQEEEP